MALLTAHDELKFVIDDEADYQWARGILQKYDLAARCPLLFSPVHGMNAGLLADWILRDHLPVRLQLQLHKLLWNDARGR
uniref:Putative radical activating enzyme n=1 Tax=mine drainage metagenome TaxID=410659 RepID=E6QQW1_9ZZZZ